MDTLELITDAGAAIVALDPVRSRLLAELREPASAAVLAERVGLTRQKVNYHLRALAAHGLVEEVATRRWGGLTERLLQATAAGYVVAPDAISADAIRARAVDPAQVPGRLSAAYLVALAARTVREVGELLRRARGGGAAPAMFALDTDIGFRTPADRAAFVDELTETVTSLVARYHADAGRPHRLVVTAHPTFDLTNRPSAGDPAGAEPEEQP